MKVLTLATALLLTASMALADHHDEKDKKEGHDAEHSHVKEKADHAHTDEHHKDHDHKAHHPEHVESVKKEVKTKKK